MIGVFFLISTLSHKRKDSITYHIAAVPPAVGDHGE